MIYYVSQKNGNDGNGSRETPFSTIGQAAQIARPGDTVVIGGGIYREWVDPRWGGSGENQRITYCSAPGETPVISGAEVVESWTHRSGTIWTAVVDNALFGDSNPYRQEIFGDWFDGFGQVHHTGEVYMDGAAMYEAASLEQLSCPGGKPDSYKWFACVGPDTTTFYGNFQEKNPNEICVEISVRPYCFFPSREGRNYITVSGLTMRQAATQWAPPTAFQPGLLGTHWSKGWIIENCTVSESKCVGISLGKREDVKDNLWSRDHRKGGAQTYTEIIFTNLNNGWSKERVGSHIVRNNEIYNCGQAGIVGNMGCAFSDIIGNHIHHINDRHEFGGAEMAGIKFHSAIDTVIAGNCIHDCTNGLWLDWQAQGAAVRRNSFFDNNQDLFIEVCHGPCLVENNLFLSVRNFLNFSQGTACVHNLFAGEFQIGRDINRFTMYHIPHSTMVGGVMLIYGGDDKVANNIFVGKHEENPRHGTGEYKGYTTDYQEKTMENDTPAADLDKTLPVDIHDNVYLNGAAHFAQERNPRFGEREVRVQVTEEAGHYYLETDLYDGDAELQADRITGAALGRAFEPDQPYENRDGSPADIDFDFTGARRPAQGTTAGPFQQPCRRILLV